MKLTLTFSIITTVILTVKTYSQNMFPRNINTQATRKIPTNLTY
jgi:hypothetical protein